MSPIGVGGGLTPLKLQALRSQACAYTELRRQACAYTQTESAGKIGHCKYARRKKHHSFVLKAPTCWGTAHELAQTDS